MYIHFATLKLAISFQSSAFQIIIFSSFVRTKQTVLSLALFAFSIKRLNNTCDSAIIRNINSNGHHQAIVQYVVIFNVLTKLSVRENEIKYRPCLLDSIKNTVCYMCFIIFKKCLPHVTNGTISRCRKLHEIFCSLQISLWYSMWIRIYFSLISFRLPFGNFISKENLFTIQDHQSFIFIYNGLSDWFIQLWVAGVSQFISCFSHLWAYNSVKWNCVGGNVIPIPYDLFAYWLLYNSY